MSLAHLGLLRRRASLDRTSMRPNSHIPQVTTDELLEGLRIHDLRHTAVALWIAAGASPREVATRAGHTSVSFTLDRYGHLYPEADRALRDRLDQIHEAVGDKE
jgi:integrase